MLLVASGDGARFLQAAPQALDFVAVPVDEVRAAHRNLVPFYWNRGPPVHVPHLAADGIRRVATISHDRHAELGAATPLPGQVEQPVLRPDGTSGCGIAPPSTMGPVRRGSRATSPYCCGAGRSSQPCAATHAGVSCRAAAPPRSATPTDPIARSSVRHTGSCYPCNQYRIVVQALTEPGQDPILSNIVFCHDINVEARRKSFTACMKIIEFLYSGGYIRYC